MCHSFHARCRSHTRYKPWPKVEKFLCELEACSLVADAGCGNGKPWTRRTFQLCTYCFGSLTTVNSCDMYFKETSTMFRRQSS